MNFLETLLSKHSQERFKVMERRPYPFKYLYPPSKVLANAVDVEAKKDWYDMYEDIVTNLPKKVKVLIDIKAIKQSCCLNDKDPHVEDDEEPFGADGITELESQLAHFRVLLEKKWGHDHDNSFTYFPPDGSYSLPLTPYMLKEWARALYDGADLVSVSVPPNTVMFDLSAWVAVLNPVGHAQARSIVPQTSVVLVGQPNNIEALASLIQGIGGLVNRAPQTPVHGIITDHSIISPNILSPSQLT
ncbi:hypothetical protein PILCRDRAFT_14542 [Piloderma croceum F 1598]|uniref:Uncharacterized protein n=1 Tax=Piloderma croceum (strain F 1598) TaxID=765440 RepID=A0A0C3F2H5_PILCF|nr:hypothetical protein PILCRDRAFT_14542 [Piloderma croceum F 1598]